MQEAQPVMQEALAAAHKNDDTTCHQSPSKRKTRLQSQSKQGNSSSQLTPSSRCTRSQAAPDWTVQEVLVLLSKIVYIDEIWFKELSSYQRWKMISDSCIATNVARSSNQCKRKWEMLLDDYDKIMNWEPQSKEDSYWFLSEEGRKNHGLPVSFQKEVFDAMDAVLQVQQQLSDSSNSDPERIFNVPEFETSKMKADSEVYMLHPPLSVQREEVITSKSSDITQSTLKRLEKAPVLAGHELITTSKGPEVEESILQNQENALVLAAGVELITTSKNSEVGDPITTSKSSTQRPESEELNTASKNLNEKPDVEDLITASKMPEVEELVTTSNSSEQRLQMEELNTTSKSLEERARVVELITASKSPKVEDLIATSKSPEKSFVMAVSEELIPTSKSSVVEELITTSKSSEKVSVITGSLSMPFKYLDIRYVKKTDYPSLDSSMQNLPLSASEQEDLITNSKSSEKAPLITAKLQENAEHVCAILRGELQPGASNRVDSSKPSAAETEFARRQADELIKALAQLTESLDELCDHVNQRRCAGIVAVDSMAG